ncbi:MAG: 2-amino-4-hydroxy-6-hydroxymethyldihydropteridine diphosphokinase, partial [Desulfobacterales bacterium]
MTDKNPHTVYIAVGANLGDRIAGCRRGVELLSGSADLKVIHHSPYYYSEPVGFAEQPWFVNAVFQASTALDPYALLAELKKAEKAAGRQEGGIRFGPRIVDLDLIFYDEKIIQTP